MRGSLLVAGVLGCSHPREAATVDAPLGASAPCANDCSAAGCAPVLVFPFDPFSERGLAIGTHDLCVAFEQEGTDNTEYDAIDRCGGAPSVTTVSNGYADGMLLDGDQLTTGVGISSSGGWTKLWRRDLSSADPGQATLLWSDSYPFGFDNLVRHDDTLYFSYNNPTDPTHQGIYSVAYAGGTPTQISDWVLQDVRHALVEVGDTLYFSYIQPGGQYGLYAMSTSGGMPSLLAIQADAGIVNTVATDGSRLYWGALGSTITSDGLVGSLGLDGSNPMTLAHVTAQVLEVVADSDTIYFTTDGAGGMGLYAVPIAGGDVTTLVADVPRVDLLRQDADYLFFVGAGGAYRLLKPRFQGSM